MHFSLTSLDAAFCQPLLGRHTPNVVVKSEGRRQQWGRPRGRVGQQPPGGRRGRPRAMHSHVKAPRVFFVRDDLEVLKEPYKGRDAPT